MSRYIYISTMIKKIIIALFVVLLFSISATAQFFTENNATSPYQYNVTISDSSGTNNATNVFLNGNAGTNFSSVYFTNQNGTVTFPHCVLQNSTGKTWVNITQAGVFRLNYGNLSRANSEDCSATFYQFQDNTTTDFLGALTVNYVNTAFEAKVKPTNAVHDLYFGLARATVSPWGNGAIFIQTVTATNLRYIITRNGVTDATQNEAPSFTNDTDVNLLITLFGATYQAYVDGNAIGVGTATQLPTTPMGLYFRQQAGTGRVHYAFARNFTSPEPTLTAWGNNTADEYISIITSDNIRYSDASAESTTNTTYVKLKEINITENYSGSWRIVFTLTGDNSITPSSAWIYKNGVPYGTERAVIGTTTTFSEEFTNINIISGDSIQIYGKAGGILTTTYIYNFGIYFDYDYANFTPTLTYPINGSTISFAFPPQFADINFTWTNVGTSGYQIQVAKDSDFNLIAWDVTSTTNSKTLPLEADVWYWRVRTYNDGGTTLGDWSDTFTFTFSETAAGATGTNINGVVFEYIGGVSTPITGASVYLTNSTYTTFAVTGSNGYFLFDDLDNSTYSLYAIKQGYDNSQVFAVLPTFNATTTVNLPMRIYISPYVPNFVFEKFIVRSLFDDPYTGVTVNIFVGSSLNPSFTGTTDSMGQVVFQLVKDTYYRIELSGGGLTDTITEYFYGKEEAYYITIAFGFPDGGDKFEDINATLYVTELNSTHANLSLYYSDNSNTTSMINFYARYYINGTDVCANQSSVIYPTTLNCTVTMGNFTYLFGWNSTSSQYGISQGELVVDFKANDIDAQLPGLSNTMSADMMNWLSIIGLIFIAGIFSAKSVKFAAVVVPVVATIMYWIGTLQVSAILVHSALIFGILVYLRMNEQKVIS